MWLCAKAKENLSLEVRVFLEIGEEKMMEVCVDSITSALNAQKGGASRIELCSSLAEGGLTPSIGLIQRVKSLVQLPVFVMIRPRGGDFCYSQHELEVMLADLSAVKDNGVDGAVLGVLTRNGDVDMEKCHCLLEHAHPLPVTFHRGGGITETNVEEILSKSGATEFHASASVYIASEMTCRSSVTMGTQSCEQRWKVCDPKRVTNMVKLAQNVINSRLA
ncbi:copper homeostasis protein cutC homolog isoform X3 [Tachypleus tridentatus]|uniref:copper homeostasis protein cutC homolog isoform X3 n=1 Tax=Tachypleus tridentatus TaxID=6853 RepID=UPI003FCEF72C